AGSRGRLRYFVPAASGHWSGRIRAMSAGSNVNAEQLDEFLGEREDELIELVQALVAIDSQIPPYADEREVVQFLSETLARYGLGDELTVLGPKETRP